MVSSRQRRHILGIALLAISAFTALSMLPVAALGGSALRLFSAGNVMGVLGAMFAAGGTAAFGVGIVLVPVLFAVAGAACFEWLQAPRAARWAALVTGLTVLLPTLTALFSVNVGFEVIGLLPQAAAGWVGSTVALPFAALLGGLGALLALCALLLALCVATIGWNPLGAAARHVRELLRRRRDEQLPDGGPQVPAPPTYEAVNAEPVLAGVAARREPGERAPGAVDAPPSLLTKAL
ncbi:MAG: DNA translocase FtsK 4TM domain-containing protein, partial [Gemmatimonadota bacterium]